MTNNWIIWKINRKTKVPVQHLTGNGPIQLILLRDLEKDKDCIYAIRFNLDEDFK